MKIRKILGIICIIVSAIFLFLSHYIAEQVAQGKTQLREGKQAIKTSESIFGMSKYTKPIGKTLTSPGHRKIEAGEEKITKYSKISRNLKIGGIGLIIAGLALIFLGSKKK